MNRSRSTSIKSYSSAPAYSRNTARSVYNRNKAGKTFTDSSYHKVDRGSSSTRSSFSKPAAAPNRPTKAAITVTKKPAASAAFKGNSVAGSVANAVADARSKPSYRKPAVPLAGSGFGRPLLRRHGRLGRVRQKLSSR